MKKHQNGKNYETFPGLLRLINTERKKMFHQTKICG